MTDDIRKEKKIPDIIGILYSDKSGGVSNHEPKEKVGRVIDYPHVSDIFQAIVIEYGNHTFSVLNICIHTYLEGEIRPNCPI